MQVENEFLNNGNIAKNNYTNFYIHVAQNIL
jgi:hypothetical protein